MGYVVTKVMLCSDCRGKEGLGHATGTLYDRRFPDLPRFCVKGVGWGKGLLTCKRGDAHRPYGQASRDDQGQFAEGRLGDCPGPRRRKPATLATAPEDRTVGPTPTKT